MKAFALLAILAGLAAHAAGETSAVNFAAADAYSRECGGKALVVLRMGNPVLESYADESWRARPLWVMSITKNLAAMAVLAADADGILDLDERASKTLTEWRGDEARARITIRQLLNQTSGLASGYDAIYGGKARDKNKVAIRLRCVAEPGTRFDYAPGNYELLEEILRRKLAPSGRTPLGYLQSRVLGRIGVRPADWRRDGEGNPFFSAGAKLTAGDLAKIGEFVRTHGRVWIFPVISPWVFAGAFTGSRANSMYGLSFWLNANARRAGASPLSIEGTLGADRSPAAWRVSSISSVAPPDLFAMVGSGGLRVYVVPSRKLVIVRVGTGRTFSDAIFLGKLFGAPRARD